MEENVANQNSLGSSENSSPIFEDLEENRSILFGMEWWELGVIALSIGLIVFVAIPGYFNYLDQMRGKESSNRLTLIANCLQYLANQNQTQPGKKICELFDLNETLEMAQRHIYSKMNIAAERAIFLKVGAEPDDPGGGDYVVNLYLKADGSIVEPTCTLAYGPKGDYYREQGLYVADMSKVDGKIGVK